jgi:uncharacterized membrane protein
MFHLKKAAIIFFLLIVFSTISSVAHSVRAETMCCPEGFSDAADPSSNCPSNDSSKCCNSSGLGPFTSHVMVPKVSAYSAGLTGNFCCPLGYGTGIVNCSAKVDDQIYCCKRPDGLTGAIDIVPKISCTLPPVCQTDPTIPPAPCASNMSGGVCTKLPTGLGDINVTTTGIVTSLLSIILSVSGGIALILIIMSGYKILSSQGNPESIKGAREQLTAAIVGLLFIIFALVILQIIGVDILRLPGFNSGS